MKGKLYGIGVGPGDPELLTLKAKRLIEECDIVAVPPLTRLLSTPMQMMKRSMR